MTHFKQKRQKIDQVFNVKQAGERTFYCIIYYIFLWVVYKITNPILKIPYFKLEHRRVWGWASMLGNKIIYAIYFITQHAKYELFYATYIHYCAIDILKFQFEKFV